MKEIHLAPNSYERHETESRQRGEWIYYVCPKCDYVRKFNYQTGETSCTGGNPQVIHHGKHDPYKLIEKNQN